MRAHEARVAEALEIIDELQGDLRAPVSEGDVKVDIDEFVALTKLGQLLSGEPTDRVEVHKVHTLVLAVVQVAGEFVPRDRRDDFRDRLDEVTAGFALPGLGVAPHGAAEEAAS